MNKFYFIIAVIYLILNSGCKKGSISGKITDKTSGESISGVLVSTEPPSSTVITDINGYYDISNIDAGNYTLVASKSGYLSDTVKAKVIDGQTTTVNIVLIKNTDIPVAGFNYGGNFVTPAVITFTNTSRNADSYLWDFGDGTASTQLNPIKTYNQFGTYEVTLTAFNTTSGISNKMRQTITIKPGKVYLQKVIINSIPLVDKNGASWDYNSWPDVYYSIVDSVDNVIYTASNYKLQDLTPANLPDGWILNPELPLLNWDKTYYVVLWDYDPFDEDDFMGYTQGFNIDQLINYPTTISLKNANQTIKITLTLRWE